MSLIQKLDMLKAFGVTQQNADDVIKGWDTVKDRSKEITSATKFMDVIM